MELSRIISDLNEEIKVSINDNQVLFAANDIEFTSRLIEGQFPNYKQIIPEDNETKAVVATSEFSSVLKVATLFARENANSVSLSVKSKGQIEVVATSAQLGESDSVVNAEVTGKDGEIAFNGKYLIDVLNNIKDPKVVFESSGKLSAGVIQPSKDKDYTYIIMPLRS
jgi:DNA polymerase-3 subunit beta